MAVIGDITRAAICASPGNRLVAADFPGVEARMLAWLAGEQSEDEQWAIDRTGDPADEPYFITGAATRLDRDKGKTCTLAFGYMGGVGAYRVLAKDDTASDEEIKRRQQAWRAVHPATVKFWGDINRAVQERGRTFKVNRHISFTWGAGGFLRMRLPSGRELAYPFPRLVTDPRGECAAVFKDYEKGKWVDCRKGKGAYGGTWTENAVQAASRDLLVAAMPRLEAAGYPIVLHVHDEIVAEVPSGFGSEEEFLRLVTEVPDWARGLPIAPSSALANGSAKSAIRRCITIDSGALTGRALDDHFQWLLRIEAEA